MKLYIVSTEYFDYDEYDSFVIVANSEEEAKKYAELPGDEGEWTVEEIGISLKNSVGIVHSSFNAG